MTPDYVAPPEYVWRGVARKHRNNYCFWCNAQVSYKRPKRQFPQMATRDHLIPASKGGRGIGNMVVACSRCNHARADNMKWLPKYPTDAARRFVEWVKEWEWLQSKEEVSA